MCGRFVLFANDQQLVDIPEFSVVRAPVGAPPPRYNIAPTHTIPILRLAFETDEALIEPARWGLIPPWKRDISGPPLFNARAETVRSKPSFADAFRQGRCLIPMNGYYEWANKIPYWITTGSLIWVAGLYSTALGQLSATMITTESAPPLDAVHHRMPRFLSPSQYQQWLARSDEEAGELLRPTEPELIADFRLTQADVAVGNVANDYPELIESRSLF